MRRTINGIGAMPCTAALVMAAANIVYSQEPTGTAPAPETAVAVGAGQGSGAAGGGWFTEKLPAVIREGTPILDVRARYEHADQDGLDGSNAFTVRTRLGFQTGTIQGFNGLIEFEDVTIIGSENNYNQAGLSGAGRTVIADPETTELNRAWIGYENFDTALRYGRQRIILDNARFIGNVGWRQNEQTYDGVTLKNQSIPDTTVFYSYIHNVNRIFGDDHPAGDFESNSHLANISYAGCPYGTIVAYGYFLDLDNAAALSANTFGGSFAGAYPVTEGVKVDYRAEFAHQVDAGNNPVDFSANYYHIQGGASYQRFSAGAGYEVLDDDNGVGFSTPLATLHAFNGWADTFLATPANGLEDVYGYVGVKLPYDIPLKLVYHDYQSSSGNVDYGNEFDVVMSRKFGKHWAGLVKYAYYDGDGGFADRQKFWVQAEFKF